jgi:hypothetical protein
MAHRVESLRCEGSEAIGAKRTCRERRKRVDLTKMTHIDQSPIYFAVLHNAVSEPDDVVGFGPRLEGSL